MFQRRGPLARARILAQGDGQPTGPGAGDFANGGFQRLKVGLGVVAGLEADDELNPGQGGVGEARIGGLQLALEGLGQHAPGPIGQLGAVAVARQEQEDRDIAIERVVAHEQAHARAVVQVDDLQRRLQQLFLAGLQELVAGIVLQHVAQAPVAVAPRRRPCPLQHIGDLAPDQWRLAGWRVVGFGGEQADEADLADGQAVGVVPAHADIVHGGAAVDA